MHGHVEVNGVVLPNPCLRLWMRLPKDRELLVMMGWCEVAGVTEPRGRERERERIFWF